MAAITDKDYILGFLNGTSNDFKGRSYSEMLGWSDIQLEKCHDQIQHIFPLHEKSDFAVSYPILSPDVVEEAKKDPAIIANIRAALDRFERFFGIEPYDKMKQDRWCNLGFGGRPNHNILRVTRIIRSLRIFGLEKEAEALFDSVVGISDSRFDNERMLVYWRKALNDNIWETLRD